MTYRFRDLIAAIAIALAMSGVVAAAEPHDANDDGLQGALVIVGGGRIPDEVRQTFFKLAGGNKARLVVIPTAGAGDVDAERALAPWKRLMPASVAVLHTRDRDEADSPDFAAPLRTATGVWFSGGSQSRISDAYMGTRVERALYQVLARGGVIGGTSAGAAIQSRTMIASGNPVPKMASGFDLLPGTIIDQHFLARSRQPRLRRAVADHPHLFGVGIDEATALIVEGRQMKVLGESNVTLVLAASGKHPEETVALEPGDTADLIAWRKRAAKRKPEATTTTPENGTSAARRPNVILILTDDQGFGDVGFHDNPVIRTPHLDRLARESVELTHFYVSPVCSPTRASLLTGRYNYRTGVVDTYLGRSMMHADEVTLAEILRDAGYRTGIFGKWHLGDNYPLRAMDQGFDESLVHGGGGIGQPADPPDNTYFDPVLQRNGRSEKAEGYCSDIFTTTAIEFIRANRDAPFFAYLSYNCPHTPLQVADKYREPYAQADLSAAAFPAVGNPLPQRMQTDAIARVYGMVTNIDENLGRLLAALDELQIADDTIVIFLTDNGPQQPRYNAGLRGAKGSVYEGGLRVPFLARWPGRWGGGRKFEVPAAHIDVVPTLAAVCGAKLPVDRTIDGISLVDVLDGTTPDLGERTLCFQFHRGEVPQPYRACAVRRGRYKLVHARGAFEELRDGELRFELFDLQADPYEMRDLAGKEPEVVARLRREYDAWFRDVSATRGFDPPRIAIGTPHENPVVLTRQDWRGPAAGWDKSSRGHWELDVAAADKYEVIVRFEQMPAGTVVRLTFGERTTEQRLDQDAAEARFAAVELPAGPLRVSARIDRADGPIGAQYLEIQRPESDTGASRTGT